MRPLRPADEVLQRRVAAGQRAADAAGAHLVVAVHVGNPGYFRVAVAAVLEVEPVVDVAQTPVKKRRERITGGRRRPNLEPALAALAGVLGTGDGDTLVAGGALA